MILTSAERAKDLKKKPVYVLGTGTAATHMMISQVPDLTVTPGAISGPKAFAEAGISTNDVDVLMAYDSFTITVLLHLEDLGFCKKGEGGDFVASTSFGLDGPMPVNTHGGLLSQAHIIGMNHIVELVKQLRGQGGKMQVKDAEIGLVTGYGDMGDGGVAIMRC